MTPNLNTRSHKEWYLPDFRHTTQKRQNTLLIKHFVYVHLQNTFFIKTGVHMCTRMHVYAHNARLQPTAQTNCVHYTRQYTDRCTSHTT